MFPSRALHSLPLTLEIKVKDNKKSASEFSNIDHCPGEAQEPPSRAQRLHTSVLSRTSSGSSPLRWAEYTPPRACGS